MGRTARGRNPVRPQPVQKIELSSKHFGWRLLAVLLLLAVAVASLSYGFLQLLSTEPGWVEIEANAGVLSCAGDFTFLYNIGASGVSPSTERRALNILYTQAAVKAWQLFNNVETDEGVANVRYLNDHPGEVVTVDEGLYKAFEQVERSGNRALYLAPVSEVYQNLFFCEDDALTVDFDPLLNPELRAFFAEAAAFANDPSAVRLELLGNDQVRLTVSEEYLAFAEREEITSFIDFHWMTNAFIIDYLADTLVADGYTYGTLSSYDGFSRALDDASGTVYAYNLYDGQDGAARSVAMMQYSGARSIAALRSYPTSSLDRAWYYVRKDGQIRTSFLDVADGLSRAALTDLVAYSHDLGCAEMLLQVAPVYIAEAFSGESLAEQGIQTIYCQGRVICYTDPALTLVNVDGGYATLLIQP